MPRPREYDRDAVLDTAMRTFWRSGYEGTSIRDLVDACELTTRSMYDAFGDKERFFEAALDRYHALVLTPVLELLRRGRGLSALASFVDLLAESATEDGCLYMNTGVEGHLVPPSARQRVKHYLEQLRARLAQKLEEARADGQFGGDSETRAAQLSLTVVGFMISLKMGVSRQDAAASLRMLLGDIAQE